MKRADRLTGIADDVNQLVEPYQHAERYLVRRGDRQQTHLHRARHPSLLNQLRAALEPGSDTENESGKRPADTAPPVAMGALDVLLRIEAGSADWVSQHLGLPSRDTVESNLRALVGHAGDCDDGLLTDLHHAVEAWWRWARIESQWDGRPRDLRDPCPYCGRRKLRVAWDVTAAWCTGCAATWGETEVGMLGAMIDQQRQFDTVNFVNQTCA